METFQSYDATVLDTSDVVKMITFYFLDIPTHYSKWTEKDIISVLQSNTTY